MPETLFQSNLPHLELLHRGKVRDIYAVDQGHMLIVASDRLSAFDVIMPQGIPGKGEVLTRVANFWFDYTQDLASNHLSNYAPDKILDPTQRALLGDRAIVVKRLTPLPIEAIVRGYVIGYGWKDYHKTGAICGITLPANLRQADRLPEPIYTPSSKAQMGNHDENIHFDRTVELVGGETAEKIRTLSLEIYRREADYAIQRGIIIADTKFEFGIDDTGEIHLIDEVLTPDSSRFWPLDQYRPGISPPSFDKQFVRDYLETLDWDKTPPGPDLPREIVTRTAEKYAEAERILTTDPPS